MLRVNQLSGFSGVSGSRTPVSSDSTLLAGETDGLAIDFTNTTYFDSQVYAQSWNQVRTSSSDAFTSPHTFYTQSGTSPKILKTSSAGLGWSPHNNHIRSSELTHAVFDDVGGATRTGSQSDPSGGTAAISLVEDSGNSEHKVGSFAAGTTGTIALNTLVTLSCYVKNLSGTRNLRILIGTDTFSNQFMAIMNPTTGATVSTATVGSGVVDTSGFTDVGGGWFRVWVTGHFTSGVTTTQTYFHLISGTTVSYAGDGTSGLYIFGPQLNRGIVPTAYVATTSAAKNGLPISYAEGLLVEPAATNLVDTTSDIIEQGALTGLTVTRNHAAAPDGTTTATRLTETGNNEEHFMRGQDSTLTVTANHTLSCYLKANAGSGYAALQFFANGGAFPQVRCVINLADGTVSDGGAADGATFTSATSQSIGNGWYRLMLTGFTGASATEHNCRVRANDDSTFTATYTGSTGNSFLAWGFQFETGAVATSYIPTVGSTVTRAADNVNVATSAIPFSATEGTVYFDGTAAPAVPANQFGWQFDDGTANEKIRFYRDTSNNPTVSIIDGGAEQVGPLDAGTITASARTQVTASWKLNLVAASIGGAASVDDTSATLPTVTTLRLGADINVTHWNAPIRRFVWVPRQIEEDGLTVEAWRYTA